MIWVPKMSSLSEFSQSFFEASSRAWKKNKVRYGQAMYKYKKNAFPIDSEEPPIKVTQAAKRKMEKEISLRLATDEFAPPRERRSPRLREQHLLTTYSNT